MRSPDNKHTVLMSPADSKLIDSVKKLGINIIETKPNTALRSNEQLHADMQLLVINNSAFIAGNCTYLNNKIKGYFKEVIVCDCLSGEYPDNVLLNAALVGDKLLCKVDSLDTKVKEYCIHNRIKLVNVKQGYTKCSTLVVNNNSIITADTTIHRAACDNNIDSLLISAGSIRLQDADYGFIGGCSGVVGNTVMFFGDIYKHPDCEKITDYLNSKNVNYRCITDEVMNDVGGLITLE